jgi:hypothetical protein
LGYQNGIELNKDLIAKKLLFPLPAEKKIQKMTLFLDYELKNLSSESQLILKVENKIIYSSPNLNNVPSLPIKIEIPLPQSTSQVLPVEFGLNTKINCGDNFKILQQSIQIKPSSYIDIVAGESKQNFQDFIFSLDKDVLVQLPKRSLTSSEFTQVLFIAKNIQAMHKAIRFVDNEYENKKRIVYADRDEVNNAITTQDNVFIINQDNVEIIIEELNEITKKNKHEILLESEYLDSEYSYNGQRWALEFKHQPGYRNNQLEAVLDLEITASNKKHDLILLLYHQNELIHAQKLPYQQKKQQIKINIPSRINKNLNEMKVVIAQHEVNRLCTEKSTWENLANIQKTSLIRFQNAESDHKSVNELLPATKDNILLSIQNQALSNPKYWLEYILHVIKNMQITHQKINTEFFEQNVEPTKNSTGAPTQIIFTENEHFTLANNDNRLIFIVHNVDWLKSGNNLHHGHRQHASMEIKTKKFFQEYRYYIFFIVWLILTFIFFKIGKNLR